jgi:hypothetical protein
MSDMEKMTLIKATVAVWTGAKGIPEQFIWDGKRYRVTDAPTPLEIDYASITHPPTMPLGWRFQGTSDDGDRRMFEVLYSETQQEWHLLHTYE